MFVAGTDTSSTALEWLMAELIKNLRVMKKAQEEVRRVVSKKSKIDMNVINKMDYLNVEYCLIFYKIKFGPQNYVDYVFCSLSICMLVFCNHPVRWSILQSRMIWCEKKTSKCTSY
jgi:hypothetical protein